MREMKDSGIKWIGRIPIDWKIKRVKYCYSFVTGFTPSTDNQRNYNDPEGYEWATIADINKGRVAYPTKSLISREFVKSTHKKKCPKGSLLFSFKLSVGQTAFLDREVFINEALACFMPNRKESLKFLNYSSSLIEYNSNFNIYGAKILNQHLINNAYIVYPTLEEQNSIAEFLDNKCAEIDDITEDLQEQIDTLENYKKSVITEAVTKGLNPNVEMKSSPIAWAKSIPSHWKYMPNKYIMTKIKKTCPVHNDEDIISLSMNGVVVRDLDAGGKMPATFNGYQFVYPGNLLMCLFDYDVTPRCIGYIKNYGITSPAYSQFKMNRNNFAKYYYYYYLMIDNTKELLHLAKNLRHSFTEDELGKIYAIVPPIQEQKEIANYLDNKCTEIDEIIKNKKEQLEIIEEYKKSLIYEYVTGKKEVKNA